MSLVGRLVPQLYSIQEHQGTSSLPDMRGPILQGTGSQGRKVEWISANTLYLLTLHSWHNERPRTCSARGIFLWGEGQIKGPDFPPGRHCLSPQPQNGDMEMIAVLSLVRGRYEGFIPEITGPHPHFGMHGLFQT
ncbi:uncharacterized protein CLUP02_07431 [Colletotrichum lupini]|uniref:Uncharacterized protein n=1 Tax=Colletotrichum lupini TaxID=145971 RepID=A0A9Q8SR81_9PEZI|nr:uncharacterized protein CLUP02_07431 [Colletotrichum lupini]UQC81945.1 hypothetical protein CLUP02_07431 [Colletotrichum lupini]